MYIMELDEGIITCQLTSHSKRWQQHQEVTFDFTKEFLGSVGKISLLLSRRFLIELRDHQAKLIMSRQV